MTFEKERSIWKRRDQFEKERSDWKGEIGLKRRDRIEKEFLIAIKEIYNVYYIYKNWF